MSVFKFEKKPYVFQSKSATDPPVYTVAATKIGPVTTSAKSTTEKIALVDFNHDNEGVVGIGSYGFGGVAPPPHVIQYRIELGSAASEADLEGKIRAYEKDHGTEWAAIEKALQVLFTDMPQNRVVIEKCIKAYVKVRGPSQQSLNLMLG